jgi:Pyruvate-formate lyase-activating enzyme
LFVFLNGKKGLLEGVVLCGGEPTLNPDLPDLIKKIKDLGFKVKLDTNGSNPKMLKELIENKLIDYVAMDIKLPKNRYSLVFWRANVAGGYRAKHFHIEKLGH